jgi:hypothetical protein
MFHDANSFRYLPVPASVRRGIHSRQWHCLCRSYKDEKWAFDIAPHSYPKRQPGNCVYPDNTHDMEFNNSFHFCLLSPPVFLFLCCFATNCSWSFVYWVILLRLFCYLMCIVLLCVYCCLTDCSCGLLATSQYPEGPANGHLDTGFLGFPVSIRKCWDGFQDSKLPLHALPT